LKCCIKDRAVLLALSDNSNDLEASFQAFTPYVWIQGFDYPSYHSEIGWSHWPWWGSTSSSS